MTPSTAKWRSAGTLLQSFAIGGRTYGTIGSHVGTSPTQNPATPHLQTGGTRTEPLRLDRSFGCRWMTVPERRSSYENHHEARVGDPPGPRPRSERFRAAANELL